MFDNQELIYLAMGARALAAREREKAQEQGWVGISALHAAAAKAYDELAEKVERIRADLQRGPIPVSTPTAAPPGVSTPNPPPASGKPELRLVCPAPAAPSPSMRNGFDSSRP